ncbi:MAG: sodium:solute symporter family protein [Ignavibacteriales bacterium]|nr:sodium:solute symporter family protein [Ignavibacteriales bacterium]MCF8435775.1 sodium:solute symporter family protein [Ignavibacteriales bacterium]
MEKFHNIGTSADWLVMLFYFMFVMLFGSYFGRYNRNTKDFFFGGRRFTWWLIAFSIVATGVGSHSFIKYSAMGFNNGFSSTMTYLNDWFFMPFFLFGWLPIVIYTKVQSIPEYFEKRFSPSARFLATILLIFYMVGYIGIGFLTMGSAMLPMLPESFVLFGSNFPVTLMGVVTVIAVITGIYITFGGQTAVIFTDLLQGVVLLFAGFLLFFLGVSYLGGFSIFWDMLPAEWKLPLAHFNKPSGFNFVGIFWQDGIAGSVGFLFMNMGLIMRFMATKSVDEGRKAAAFNVLFMLPLSAIVVGNAGWIGKALSIEFPDLVPPNTIPDQIFVVVANIVSHPGVFGFIMAALTAALMSTVDTLINATAAIYINDIHRPLIKAYSKRVNTVKETDKKELFAARIASVAITILGVISVLAFKNFPTIYEAHGYFHSTLTPPLVVAIFLGAFWKRFTPSGVIASFVSGVALMILGSNYPAALIGPFDHGIVMDSSHPYTYIRALYNILVCLSIAVIITYLDTILRNITGKWKKAGTDRKITNILIPVTVIFFLLTSLNITNMPVSLALALINSFLISLIVTSRVKYDAVRNTEGLTIWSIQKAKEIFKGSKINEAEGKTVKVKFKIKTDDNSDTVNFSFTEMEDMAAEVGDLVYISDARKYLGGLKSVHSVYGESHGEKGIVYITEDHLASGLFNKNRILVAEKEM